MLREVTVRKSPVLVWGESHSMVNRLSKKKERDGGNENQSRDKVIPGKWAREERRKGGKNRDVWKHISIVFARRRLDSSSSGHSDYLRGRGPKENQKESKESCAEAVERGLQALSERRIKQGRFITECNESWVKVLFMESEEDQSTEACFQISKKAVNATPSMLMKVLSPAC